MTTRQHTASTTTTVEVDGRVLCDGPALARTLHVAPATIRQWRHRGHLTRLGTDTRGRALYDLDEALALAEQTRRRDRRNGITAAGTCTVTPRDRATPVPATSR